MESRKKIRSIIREALKPILEGDSPKELPGTFIQNEDFEKDESKMEELTVVDDLNRKDKNQQE
jgi:hypothetical protein